MDHSDIIISVIVVLCIAAGVTAYGLTTPNNVFSDLAGFSPSDSSSNPDSSEGIIQLPDSQGTDNNPSGSSDNSNSGSHQSDTNNQKSASSSGSNPNTNAAKSTGGSASSGSNNNGGSSSGGSASSGSNNNGGSSSGGSASSGSNNNGGSSSGGNTPTPASSSITRQDAIDIANKIIEEPGVHVLNATWENSTWYVYLTNSRGDIVDSILINGNGTIIGRG